MPVIKWDEPGERLYETGVKKGVLYVQDPTGKYPSGVPWNGLSSVTESPSGAEATPVYADDIKYLNLYSAEEYGLTIEAYMYPNEFEECDGSKELVPGVMLGQQDRKAFGFCYRTIIGNDTEGDAHGYKLHIVYGCKASPSEQTHQTVNDSPEAGTFSWEVSTTPVNVDGFKPVSSITIDSTEVGPDKMAKLEAALYGTNDKEAYLPLPDEIKTILTSA